ncbi:MAG: hypothetical protein CMJ18_17790 [Phycisphaeraceae bacterium]|nr:hypothetical protein [Phycisphaeraceae bacterium]
MTTTRRSKKMEKPRVLIADDDPAFTRALTLRLQNEGYKVIASFDGYNALARTVEGKPDVLVLDIHMPAGDGFTVQDRIAKMPELADVPVIYVTGDTSENTFRAAKAAGALAIVHKPLEIEELIQEIERALGRRAA